MDSQVHMFLYFVAPSVQIVIGTTSLTTKCKSFSFIFVSFSLICCVLSEWMIQLFLSSLKWSQRQADWPMTFAWRNIWSADAVKITSLKIATYNQFCICSHSLFNHSFYRIHSMWRLSSDCKLANRNFFCNKFKNAFNALHFMVFDRLSRKQRFCCSLYLLHTLSCNNCKNCIP